MTGAELRSPASAAWVAADAAAARRIASETLFRWIFYAVSVGWIVCDVLFPPGARNWLLWLWVSAADRRSSVPEMPHAREHHGEVQLIGRGDHFSVPN